jgi:hypothetical protein
MAVMYVLMHHIAILVYLHIISSKILVIINVQLILMLMIKMFVKNVILLVLLVLDLDPAVV